jgi:hypothetical protein
LFPWEQRGAWVNRNLSSVHREIGGQNSIEPQETTMLKTCLRAFIVLMLGALAIAGAAVAPAHAIQWSGSNGGDDTPLEDHGF